MLCSAAPTPTTRVRRRRTRTRHKIIGSMSRVISAMQWRISPARNCCVISGSRVHPTTPCQRLRHLVNCARGLSHAHIQRLSIPCGGFQREAWRRGDNIACMWAKFARFPDRLHRQAVGCPIFKRAPNMATAPCRDWKSLARAIDIEAQRKRGNAARARAPAIILPIVFGDGSGDAGASALFSGVEQQ